mmetsp:Transcript_22159/g.72302  ORF Transcript_22159/g.72302 Transcript_22159/m.72302 type:complete len:140 (+) Transcript_22159:403-822(+)
MALVERSKQSRRSRVEAVAYAHVAVGSKMRLRRRRVVALEENALAARAAGILAAALGLERVVEPLAASLYAPGLFDDASSPHYGAFDVVVCSGVLYHVTDRAGQECFKFASTCVFRARLFQRKHPRVESAPRDDRPSKN